MPHKTPNYTLVWPDITVLSCFPHLTVVVVADGVRPTIMNHHGVLLAPFTPALLADPSSLLPVVFDTLVSRSSHSFTVIFVSPPDQPDLYAQLRQNPVARWPGLQNLLAKVHSTLAAAQWKAGRISMNVEVRFAETGRNEAEIPRQVGEHIELFLLSRMPLSYLVRALRSQ